MGETERVSQVEKAIVGLRSLVMEGAFAPNSRLPEVALSDRLGVSRTPLRQAMDRLVSEGLLDRIKSGGCKVASFNLTDIRDALELRGVIEGTATRLAAERGADPALLEEGEDILDEIDLAVADAANVDVDGYFRLNARFHVLLSRLAGSDVIERETARISSLPLASPSAFLRSQELVPDFTISLIRAQGQHRAILDAVRNREGTRAEAITREHARLAQANLAFVTEIKPHLADRVPGLALVSQD